MLEFGAMGQVSGCDDATAYNARAPHAETVRLRALLLRAEHAVQGALEDMHAHLAWGRDNGYSAGWVARSATQIADAETLLAEIKKGTAHD